MFFYLVHPASAISYREQIIHCLQYPQWCQGYRRNRRNSQAASAGDSLPASSSSFDDIQGPMLRMSEDYWEGLTE